MNTKTVPLSIPGMLTLFVFLVGLTLIGSQIIAKADASGDIAILDKSSKAFVSVVKKAKPAVVHIKVEKTTQKLLKKA